MFTNTNNRIKDCIAIIQASYKEAQSFSVHRPIGFASALRKTLENALKLFWLKKYEKEPIWIGNGKEEFNLYNAINDINFSKEFNNFVISDMNIIRKKCNAVIHNGDTFTIGDSVEYMSRLEKCIEAIQAALALDVISSGTSKEDVDSKIEKNGITEKIVYAKTNAEFLNKVYGTNYKGWMKSGWKYDNNTIVWMVHLDDKVRCGWRNTIVDNHTVREDFVGPESERLEGHNGINEPYRIIVKKGDGCFQIFGLYKYDEENSIEAHKHIWKKCKSGAAEVYPKDNQQVEKVMINYKKIESLLVRDMYKGYGGTAQVIYDECCEVFNWDKDKRYLFGRQQILYAEKATHEKYSPWFLPHNNWTETKGGNWFNKIAGNVIEEMWLEQKYGLYHDETTRVTFAKKEGEYIFLGLYVPVGVEAKTLEYNIINKKGKIVKKIGDKVWVKTYKLISDTYPISAKTDTVETNSPPTKSKYGALGCFTKN